MGESKGERQATPTRLYTDTVRLLRLLAGWEGVTMAELVDRLAREEAKKRGPEILAGIQGLIEGQPPPRRGRGRPRKGEG